MGWNRLLFVALLLGAAFVLGCPLAPTEDAGASPFGGGWTGTGGSGSGDADTQGGPPGPVPAGGNGTGADGDGTDSDSFRSTLDTSFPGCTEFSGGDAWRAEVLRLINDERNSRGLEALERNATLENQADQYACEMIYYGFFDHENPVTGSELPDRALEFGYQYAVIGENLAAGQTAPIQVVNDWMNSPGHRENILNERYTEVGVGVRAGGVYGLYWVLELGTPWP